MSLFAAEIETARRLSTLVVEGRVAEVRGLTVHVDSMTLPVGSLVSFGGDGQGAERVLGEVVGFTSSHAVVMLLGASAGLRPGDLVRSEQTTPTGPVGDRMLGRVIDGLGRPIDGKGSIAGVAWRPLDPTPISAMSRRPIAEPLRTGVRALDLMTPFGRGQRVGIFAGPGVGKSTLLGTIARRTDADVNVIALIGERGREVREFIEHALGEEGLARSVVVVATGDESPPMRLRAAKLACTAAEFFRERGRQVLLMMDSVTRFAHAQRQVGLNAGEPPATKGYTPSVFAQLALLLERAGSLDGDAGGGSVTGLYTVLVEGDDMTEPIADAARGILDGHVVLSRKLAQRAHYPAIDVLDSVSRVCDTVSTREHSAARRSALRLMALYREVEELVRIGAYARGASAETDAAIMAQPALEAILRQSGEDAGSFEDGLARLVELVRAAEGAAGGR